MKMYNELYSIMNLMERIDPQYHRYASILNEDKRGKAAKKACYSILRQYYGNADWLDKEYNVPNNPHHLSAIDWKYDRFMDKFYHEDSYQNGAIMRLAPLFLRLALNARFEQGNEDTTRINRLLAIEDYLHQANKTQGMDLKSISLDMSYNELNNAFGEAVDKEEALKKERIENGEYEDDGNYNGYEIVGPLTYEEAHEYGNKSCPGSKLCYTQGEGTWDQYTNKGMNDAYVLLRDGWESIPASHDDDGMDGYNGYDRYGLSMIFVFVNGDGRLAYCNTRWNHNANYKPGRSVDHALNEEDISKLIGKNFYKVFRKSSKWQDSLDSALNRLKNGEPLENVFEIAGHFRNGGILVSFCGKNNVITPQHEFIFEEWHDFIESGDNNNEPRRVRLNGMCNYINEDYQYISEEWFDDTYPFRCMRGCVKRDEKWNFIDTEGNIITKQWFDWAYDFKDGFADVQIGDKYNLIRTNGELLSEQWFSSIGHFNKKGKITFVKLGDKYNFINCDGKLTYDGWFDELFPFDGGSFSRVRSGRKMNLVDEDGNLVFKEWPDWIDNFKMLHAAIRMNNKWNIIKEDNAEFVSDRWFDGLRIISSDFFEVESIEGFNYMNGEGEILFDIWFDAIDGIFSYKWQRVKHEGKFNYVNMYGKFLSEKWFDWGETFRDEVAIVELNGKYNVINTIGMPLFKTWFDGIMRTSERHLRIRLNGKYNFTDTDYKLISREWFDRIVDNFYFGAATVILNGKKYKLYASGKLRPYETED